MNNTDKEIFNQFLIDYMANKMLIPEDSNGFLIDPPSYMNLPGALSIIKSILPKDIENCPSLNKDFYEKNNFYLTFKTQKTDIKIKLKLGFYLYYKECPEYKDLIASDLKNYISKELKKEQISIYKKNKQNQPEPDDNLEDYYKTIRENSKKEFQEFLVKFNKLQNKNLKIVFQKITEVLNAEFNQKKIEENTDNNTSLKNQSLLIEKEELEQEELGAEIINLKEKGFIFNKEDFETSEDYEEALKLLSENNNFLYKQLFSDINVNFIYKKLFIETDNIELDLTGDILDPTHETNIKIADLIYEKITQKVFDIIKDKKISLNIGQPLSFFHYISEEKYNEFKNTISTLENEGIPFVFYYPKIIFIKTKNNLKIMVSGSEVILNQKPGIQAKLLFDDKIFNCRLALEFSKSDLNFFNYNQNQHYKYNHAKHIFCSSFGVATEETEDSESIFISTTWNPKYYLPRNENREIEKKLVLYETWQITKKEPVNQLETILTEYKKWIDDIPENIKQEKNYSQDLEKWNNEIEIIQAGIKLLDLAQNYENNNLNKNIFSIYQSWCYTNESFSLIDKKYTQWRLFQLCFLLFLIPSIVLKDKTIAENLIEQELFTKDQIQKILKDSEERINLLFFNAGGGKTEAFLGILIFSLFFERLNGVLYGLTALIKYPLRLLLTQQTNRVLKAICSAEIIRRKYKISFENNKTETQWDFDRSFSLGIWVGSSTTPNSISKVINDKTTFEIKNDADLSFKDKYGSKIQKGLDWETQLIKDIIVDNTDISDRENKIKELKSFSISKIEDFSFDFLKQRSISLGNFEGEEHQEDVGHKKLTTCPFCDKEHITLRIYQKSLVHFCLNRECQWNLTIEAFRPLPFYIIDEDVYTRYPSVIISTTDKLARFGFVKENSSFPDNRYVLGMFGIAPFYEEETKKILWDIPKSQKENIFPFIKEKSKFSLKYKFPSLIIQDETHLLIEGLGSFSSVFERNFLQLIKELDLFLKQKLNIEDQTFYPPQIIASTATMSCPEKQLLPIYNKSKVLLFPSSGFKIYENFYSKPIKKQTYNEFSNEEYELYEISRIYNGFFLNNLNYYGAIKRYSFEYHKLIYNLYSQNIDINTFEDHIKNKYYLNQFQELKKSENFNFQDYITNNSLLNKILINYAGSKNINDKLKSLEIYLFEKDNSNSHILSDTNQVSITSDIDQKILQSVLHKIVEQKNNSLTNEKSKEIVKSIFATQSISHGVDSDMFNAMTFHGFPEFINEYIQASARIGRTNVGIVNCFPFPNNKDALIMNNFEAFHRFIDRPVLSNSIDYSTQKIIRRTLLSLFSCWFFNINRFKNDLACIENSKIKKIEELLNKQMKFSDFETEFKNYVLKVFASQNQNEPSQTIKTILEKEINKMLCEPYQDENNVITSIQCISNFHQQTYYLMTSLRDTQETAKIIIQQKNKGQKS